MSPSDFGITVYMGNDKIDENVFVTNLLNLMKVAPEYREQIVKEVLDTLGLKFTAPEQSAMMPTGGGGQLPQQSGQEAMMQGLENANTL
jgi:hypothetical protein